MKHYFGAIASYSIKFPVRVIQVLSDKDFAYLLVKIKDKIDDDDNEIIFEQDRVQFKRRNVSFFEKALSCIPNISLKRAKQISVICPNATILLKVLKEKKFEIRGFGEKLQNLLLESLSELLGEKNG